MMNFITDYLMEFWSIGVLIFFGMQLVNVILSTIKTILTVGASENSAVAISVVYYTFYNGLVKILTQQPLVL
jgi:Mg2+/Co2+ transporter CorB